MIGKALCQLFVDFARFFAVNRRGVAVIVPVALKLSDARSIDAADLRIFLCHPCRLCARGRRKHRIDAVCVELVDDICQPVELIVALSRLQRRPCKNTDRDAVDVRQLHLFDILRENIRPVEPLLGIVVAAVQHVRIGGECLHNGRLLSVSEYFAPAELINSYYNR